MQQQSVLPSYYNYVPDIDDDDDGTQFDSRNLPAEARNKAQQTYSNSQPQRVQLSFTPITSKPEKLTSQFAQHNPGQSLINDDDFLDLIRNTQNGKSDTLAPSSKTSFAYVSASPSTPVESAYDFGPTNRSPFSHGHRYSPRAQAQVHVSSTPSSIAHIQQQSSQQQFVRQSVQQQYYQPTAAAIHESYSAFDKDSPARVPLKKYQEPKPKYQDPSRGQYHQEVSIKPTKKVVSFKPSYQFSQPQYTAASQASPTPIIPTAQSQPLHYQSVQHFAQDETPINTGQGGSSQPPRQYSLVLPQSNGQNIQQAYYQQQQQQVNNSPFQGLYYSQSESFTSGGYQSPSNSEQSNTPQHPSEIKPTSEIRFQFVHQGTASPTPTPTPTPARIKYVPENLKYEIYDPNGHVNIPKEKPTIKLIASPQHLHRPLYIDNNHQQYIKKIKVQPQHLHYGPHAQVVRLQNYQSTPQPTQKSSVQSQSDDILAPIQPSRATFYAAQSPSENAGNTVRVQPLLQSASAEKQTIASEHQTHTVLNNDASQVRKPLSSLPITSPKKPISQAEFEALQKQALAQGIQIQAIPVPVPVPISSDRYRQQQQQQQQREQFQQSHGNGHTQTIQTAHHHHHAAQSNRPQATGTHYIRYHPKQQESEEGILTSYLRPLMEYIGGPSKP